VGGIGQKRPTCIHVKSNTYDWFGLVRVGRNGFDSRYSVELSIHPPDLIACVLARQEKWLQIDSGLECIGGYRRARAGLAHPPTQLPTQNSYR